MINLVFSQLKINLVVYKIILICFIFIGLNGKVLGQSFSNKNQLKDTSSIPKGEVLKFYLNNSKLYPGTSRAYWIYIPKQYKAEKPACLYVCMDEIKFNAPAVFDSLIATKEMPVTIGVFIQSGTILDQDSSIIRYNRTNEFDNMNDRFARFIEEEILPEVKKQKASDGRPINISANGNDHAIAGGSSGAICAFTAAWHRPDLFSRVFSTIGTYVGMRGGDQYPVLIRKTEPKAIRIYLQDNDKDTWNPLFGDWYKANLDMEAALSFAGFEVNHKWNEGGHDTHPADAIFADAMKWLWKGWPETVKKGNSENDLLKKILLPNELWQEVDPKSSYTKTPTSKNIVLPNSDLYNLQDGVITFKSKGKSVVVDKDAGLGNTFAISPDKKQLVVSARHSHWLYNYIIQADGTLKHKQKLYWLHNPGNEDEMEIGSLAFDRNGNLYVASSLGVQICDQNGRVRGILSLPAGAVMDLWFGKANLDTLFVICGGKTLKRKLNTKGSLSTQQTIKPVSQGGG